MFPTSNGVPYLPDGATGIAMASPLKQRPAWLQIIIFLTVFWSFQSGYAALRDTWVERIIIDTCTVQPAAAVIKLITPGVLVEASGTRLKAPGGGVNIRNGCEGTEVLFLLYAALLSVPLTWRAHLTGAAFGTLLVFVLNQGRIVTLFYASRADAGLFNILHGTVAPLVLIALTALYFLYWLRRTA